MRYTLQPYHVQSVREKVYHFVYAFVLNFQQLPTFLHYRTKLYVPGVDIDTADQLNFLLATLI